MTFIRRSAITIALVAAAALVLGVAPAAAKSCARQIIDDWYKDGRVDGTYALHCYDEAIDELPEDVVQYSSAKEDIERALQDALAKGAPTDSPRTTPDDSGDDRQPVIPPTSKPPTQKPPVQPTTTPSTTPRDPDAGDSGTPEAVGDTSSNASSLPLPLIVLSGLALLLLAAGGAGYLNRRLQARRIDGGTDDGEPPAEL
jgi:hypothetical protein